MAKINVLSKQTAELIAAGEVVERPASAIKEMVENAIDAGATRIKVEIEHGGIVMMRITDNGCGIMAEDVKKAFMRHATSKIATEEDLQNIGTLGFRGEALAAICMVSRVSMLTCANNQEMGTHYVIDGGEEKICEEVGCAKGTVIEVRDLFYNTPARMKFLKKDVKEGANVATIIDRMALSHPEIAFEFIKDGKKALTTAGNGNLKDTVYSVLGRDIALGTMPIEYKSGPVEVSGLICKPYKCRPTRNLQIVFLNGRFVKSATAMAALDVGYKNSAMVGKFPYCILNIKMPYGMVDVNVHPAKTEVRFSDESVVFDAIHYGVKKALTADTSHPEINLNKTKTQIRMTSAEFLKELSSEKPKSNPLPITENNQPFFINVPKSTSRPEVFASTDFTPDGKIIMPKVEHINTNNTVASVNTAVNNQPPQLKQPQKIIEEQPTEKPIFIGEVFKTYIIAQWKDAIYLIDKHATHERILFENLKSLKNTSSQVLLSPQTVTLDKNIHSAVITNEKKLSVLGFDIEDFGDGTVIVRAVPSILKEADYTPVLEEIGENLIKTGVADTERIDNLYHTIACKAATKSGYFDSEAELIKLMNEALTNNAIRYCPHGRPVAVEITKKELEKMFGRIQ